MRLAILGSTGSVGRSTLDVVALHPRRFQVEALAGRSNVELMLQQCQRWAPPWVAMEEPQAAQRLRQQLRACGSATQVLEGADAIVQLAASDRVDCVMAAISGAAGLRSTLAAAESGKRLLLANKESAVAAGHLLMAAVARGGATLIPIDSEHNAIFQCLPVGNTMGVHPRGVRRLLLTASGGPFLHAGATDLERVSPEQACAHPRWSMGRKISVDSATLMNKGLELIEASVLFGVEAGRIEVLVHPQSVVHSLVEYEDGSVLAELAGPDMRVPIAQALAWPERMPAGVEFLDLLRVRTLEFLPPDPVRFPCLRLARQAAVAGRVHCASLNAADEVAVQAFLDKRLNFGDIPRVIEQVLDSVQSGEMTTLDDVLAVDSEARIRARAAVERCAAPSSVHA